ncbi:MAG: hypothetical protein EA396_02075 [Anaerolineaceae bacterium]|nr:MAG: hypothetical protein EA396_02075 [Anaerolineaceae bacterium]
MNLPPFFQMAIAIFIASFIISVIWVYVRPPDEAEAPPPDQLSDVERRRLEAETHRRRRAAQDRLFAALEQTKAIRETRTAMNAARYNADDLPEHVREVTVVAAFSIDYDAYRALCYALAGDVAFDLHAFDAYWDDPQSALWAWQADNIVEDYAEGEIKRVMQDRHARMRAALAVVGWQAVRDERPDEDLYIAVYRRKNE